MNVTQKEVPRSAEFPVPAGASTAPAMRPFDTARTVAHTDPVVGGSYRNVMHQADGMAVEHVGGCTSALDKLAARVEPSGDSQ